MNHNEVLHSPSRPQQARYDEIVAIIAANPGLSIRQISREYYGDRHSSDNRGRMSAMLLQLCYQNRIKYQDVNRYIAVKTEGN
jgi:hypothetical protein